MGQKKNLSLYVLIKKHKNTNISLFVSYSPWSEISVFNSFSEKKRFLVWNFIIKDRYAHIQILNLEPKICKKKKKAISNFLS